ncbi:arrestin domain-containing protein [Lichtheimia corymbifera JMRC:FSU:9682]|uniref:Arrestin domain-containing protein n=1 Tax=Lichtheimia corymbifera JMRC:FSU:9682 TaxID=1263082 RepID=A0A068RVN3_9FUNG|nr:arrestin domain-containing protein [Lichtheimia corymbifera JMRC:FSU:9682]
MHLLSSGSDPLNIQLESDQIILHGLAEESAGATIRGSVTLDCIESTKIKSIALKLVGKNTVWWSEGQGSSQRHYHEERTVIEHSWNILEAQRKAYHLPKGSYKWDFELPLPGDLPSTLHHDQGQVHYHLKAVAERTTFTLYNYVAKRAFQITRLMLPSSLELNQSVVVVNEWPNKVAYNISIPRMVFSPGSQVPISFELAPLTTGLSVQGIMCSFEEYVTLTSHSHSMSEGRVVKAVSDNKFSSSQDQWSRTEVFNVPEDGNHLQCDVASSLISISHKLKVMVMLKNEDGHTSELRATMPIVIASVAPEQEANELPAYEDAWKSQPYDARRVIETQVASGQLPSSLAFATPCAAASQIRPSCSESSSMISSDDEEAETLPPLPWEGVDLTLVPSYTTAVRSGRLYSFSGPSLPTYESIAMPGTSTAV